MNAIAKQIIASIALLHLCSVAQGDEPLTLRAVMQDMGRHMQSISDGISREEWAQVEKSANSIAAHPQPSAPEKVRIMNFLGADMGKFKAHDNATHKAAQAISDAAAKGDGGGVIDAFRDTQTACLNCHREFRKPLVGAISK